MRARSTSGCSGYSPSAHVAASAMPETTHPLERRSSVRPIGFAVPAATRIIPVASPNCPTTISTTAASLTLGPTRNAPLSSPGPSTKPASAAPSGLLQRVSRNQRGREGNDNPRCQQKQEFDHGQLKPSDPTPQGQRKPHRGIKKDHQAK